MILNHTEEEFFFRVRTKEPICGIYMITSPSGKKYVGQSVNIIWRIYRYSRMQCEKQYSLFNSLKKYGWENHAYEILQVCPQEQLNDLEVKYIQAHDTFNTETGLNLRTGGNHSRMSEQSRQKLRLANIGKKYSQETNYKKGAGFRGKKLPEDVKEKMRIAQRNRSEEHIKNHKNAARKGALNPMFGKKWTEEHRQSHIKKITEKHRIKREMKLNGL